MVGTRGRGGWGVLVEGSSVVSTVELEDLPLVSVGPLQENGKHRNAELKKPMHRPNPSTLHVLN